MKKTAVIFILLTLFLSACSKEPPAETTYPSTDPTTSPATLPTELTAESTTASTTMPTEAPTTATTTQPVEPPATYLYGSEKYALEKLFQPEETRGEPEKVNYYNRILWCDFSSPEQIDLEILFYNQDLDENWELTAEEKAYLLQQGVLYEHDEQALVIRVSAEKVNAVLEQCFGLTLEQTDLVGLEKLTYFANTDCYYQPYSSNGICNFEISEALKLPDGTITVEYEILDADDWQKVITLQQTESGYRVLSNITLPREVQPPDYKPTLEQKDINGKYYSEEAFCFSYDEAKSLFNASLVNQRKHAMNRCVNRHDLIEGALYEYCKSKDSITLIEERPVLDYTMTRECYFYILKEDPTTIWQKPRSEEPATVFYRSDKGNIAEIQYYGYETLGDLVFVLDNTYVMFYSFPDLEITQVYEGAHGIDTFYYDPRYQSIHMRDAKRQAWIYYLEDGKLEGPFE